LTTAAAIPAEAGLRCRNARSCEVPYTRLDLIAAAFVLALMLAGCGAMASSGGATDLNETAWTLATLPGYSPLTGRPVTMRFENGRVHGTDGCNRYSAAYTTASGGFKLSGAVASTKMACPEPVMKQADAFVAALSRARAARIDGGQLTLLDAGGMVLATLTTQGQALAGTVWQVTGYNNGKRAVVSVLAGSTLTIAFAANGKVGGSAGCNRYTATYSSSGQSITLGKAAATRMMCARPAGVMEQEAAFLQALEMVARARVDGDRLELRSSAGALAVTAVRSASGAAFHARDRAPDSAAGRAAAGTQDTAAPVIAALGLRLPATFRGDLPCADCEAIRHHLDLWPDQVFHLRREWLGKRFVRDEVGRWRVDPARQALVLHSGGEMPLQFEVMGPDTLRLLDMQGKPIASRLPYELASDGSLTPTDLSLSLAGEMTYMADAARFTECLTGRSYPVAMEGDFLRMERAYLKAAKGPGAPLFVTFEGSIVDRPKMEGAGVERTVVVNRFIDARPSQRCERAMPNGGISSTDAPRQQ
jgi:heat shock protein HslJ